MWRFAPAAGVTLVPGPTYTIGALYTATDLDSYVSSNTSITTAAEVNHVVAVSPAAGSLGFSFPTSDSVGNRGRHGPNFLFTIGGDCACLANLTAGDCQTNVNDFFAFLALYQAQDPQADFAPGGGINVNDFFAYLAAYQNDLNNPDCPN